MLWTIDLTTIANLGFDLEDFGNEQEDESSLGLQDRHDDFESTCVEENEVVEGKVEHDLTFLKDITSNESPSKNVEEGDLVSSLENDIGDYFYIKKEKWEIVGPQFDYAPIYDIDKENEVEIGFSFIPDIIGNDISIDAFGKENYYFPLHKEE